MKKAIIFTTLASIAIALAACSTETSNDTANSANNPTLSATTPVNDANTNPTLANMPTPNTANMKEVAPGIPVAANANVQMVKPDMTKSAKSSQINTPGTDNSEITSSLGEKMVSTRTFKGHSTVAKVEQIMISGEDQKITIFLKNGQSKVVPYNKDIDVMKITGDELAKLAGVAPKTAPAPPPAKGETKKNEGAKSAETVESETKTANKP